MTLLQSRAIAILALAMAIPIGTARADHHIKTISKCTTITESGSYSVIKTIIATAGDLQQVAGTDVTACIVIGADNVTLNLQGFTIIGSGVSGNEIGARGITSDFQNRRGIKVHSGNVRDFNRGVSLFGTSLTVEQVNSSHNQQDGILVQNPFGTLQGHRVVGNTTNANGIGIQVGCPSVVLQNMATGNTALQINTFSGGAPGAVCTYSDNSPLVPS